MRRGFGLKPSIAVFDHTHGVQHLNSNGVADNATRSIRSAPYAVAGLCRLATIQIPIERTEIQAAVP